MLRTVDKCLEVINLFDFSRQQILYYNVIQLATLEVSHGSYQYTTQR